MGIRILEVSHVTPSTGAAAEQTLPLLHFDIAWIPVQHTESVYFYDYKHTESHFLDTLVPNLKKSLSLSLNHFLPLAGTSSSLSPPPSLSLTTYPVRAPYPSPTSDSNVPRWSRQWTSFWSHVRSSEPVVRPTLPLLACNLKATFELSQVQIQCLKNILLGQEPALGQVSSYVTVTAYMWSCLAQSAAVGGENVDDDEDEYFSVSVDCRGRLTPPLPAAYFGNCLVFVLARSTHGLLKGRLGFSTAARAIASSIRRIVKNERGVVARAEEEYLRRKELVGKRLIGASITHHVDRSNFDFGWGGVRKFEVLHVDYNKSMSLNRMKQGFEVGLSMPKPKMDAFAAFFKKNLSITSNM